MNFNRTLVTNLLFALIPMLLLGASASAGGVLFVDDDASPGGDGTSWDTSYLFLQDALAVAEGGGISEIHVAQGKYTPDRDEANPKGTGDRQATFQLINGVAIMGGYAGIGAKDPDARNIELYETILSGDLQSNDEADFKNNNENSYHVITASDTDATALLDGFTITAGNADLSAKFSVGGGCLSQSGHYTVHSCKFIENLAYLGGAIYNINSNPTITSCIFQNNSVNNDGGGIYNDTSSPTITACQFLGNTSTLDGAAMFNEAGSDVLMMECIFSGNISDRRAGGVRNRLSNSSFIDCVFTGNSASTGGGAIANDQSNTPIINCTFTDNFASSGGGISNGQSSPQITNCTFNENHAGDGGAISNHQFSNPSISGCDFIANEAGAGGAILNNSDSSLNIFMCNFIANVASGFYGGAIANNSDFLRIDKSVFDGNSSRKRGGAVYNLSAENTVITSCVFTNNQSINPNGTDGEGGAVYNVDSSITLINCEMNGNSARQGGGALFNWASTMNVYNCLITNNQLIFDEGGAVFNYGGGTVNMINCTIASNTAITSGGAVFSSTGLVSLTNCISWDNFPDEISGDAVAVSYSSIKGGFDGIGNIDVNPKFINPNGGYFWLAPNSPCIDAGNNEAVPSDEFDIDNDGDTAESLPIDLLYSLRFVDDIFTDDTGNGKAPVVDMGAYEFIQDCNTNGVPDPIDIIEGMSDDCNENSIPDECDVIPAIFAESGQLGPIGIDSPQTFTVKVPPIAFDDVSLSFVAVADLQAEIEYIDVDINGVAVGSVFVKNAQDCPKTPNAEEIVIFSVIYNDAVAGGDAIITMTASDAVNPNACVLGSYITVAMQYSAGGSSDDLNENGIPDECEEPGDLNGDGVINTIDLLMLFSSWGLCDNCDNCVADLNKDCSVSTSDLLILFSNWG